MADTIWHALRHRAATLLIPDLLAFVEEVADFSGNSDLQVRARVLLARIDLETKKLVKQEAQRAG
jgi:hypothetical protein